MSNTNPLFSDKYLDTQFSALQFDSYAQREQKLTIIKKWQASIANNAVIYDKEEALQADFIEAFFIKILDYSKARDTGHWTLRLEQKTNIDSTKMDAALGYFAINNKEISADVRVVIELKDARTDLDKPQTRKNDNRTPVQQAFDYANSVGGSCRWIIVSNFIEIRLYYQTDRSRYHAFDILTLDQPNNFKQFYFLLHKSRLIKEKGDSYSDKLYFERQAQELDITKRFYKTYTQARKDFFEGLKVLNPKQEPLVLLTKTQKLLDRILFIHFCEDSTIIPAYTLKNLIKTTKAVKFDFDKAKIYRNLRCLFSAINEGYPNESINRFNGGLFAEDALLNNLRIDDDLISIILNIIDYDFGSDLNVNILGHIFEQSITDLEKLRASLSDDSVNEKHSKRKKDGIYYTPDNITRYIVEQAIGGWLQDRRAELAQLYSNETELLQQYWQVLSDIKVLDPACGSGAFLNQAFDFLNTEMNIVAAQLMALGVTVQVDNNRHILEHNLFGVDLNAESVSITKLSLWLKTANNNKELTSLDHAIKCGNSLCDDKMIAGDKAFVWQTEFSDIMASGGFDVIIGNPPYLRLQGLKDAHYSQSVFYEKHYKSATGNYDIYVLFLEKAYDLLKQQGIASFILPHKWLISEFGVGIRRLFIENKAVKSIDHFETYLVFDEVSTYTCVTALSKTINNTVQFRRINPALLNETTVNYTLIDYKSLSEENWNLGEQGISNLLNKINQQPLKVSDVFERIFQGIATSADNVFLIKGNKEGNFIKGYSKQLDKEIVLEIGLLKPLVKGDNVSRYKPLLNQYYVIFPYLLLDDTAKPMTEEYIKNNFPKAYLYLKENEQILRDRENGKMNHDSWFLYIYPKSLSLCDKQKLISPDITLGMNLSYDNTGLCVKNGAYGIIISDNFKDYTKHFLALGNSALMWFFLKNTGTSLRGGYFRFNTNYVYSFKFPEINAIANSDLAQKANIMLEQNQALQKLKAEFLDFLQASFPIKKLSIKLQHYEQLNWADFQAELAKLKINLIALSDNNHNDLTL